MTISPKAIGPTVLGTSAAAIYTSAANTTTVITRASVNNSTAGAVKLQIWIVRAGDTAQNSNLLIGIGADGMAISAGPSDAVIVNALAGFVLGPGDAIYAASDTASALNFSASGYTQ